MLDPYNDGPPHWTRVLPSESGRYWVSLRGRIGNDIVRVSIRSGTPYFSLDEQNDRIELGEGAMFWSERIREPHEIDGGRRAR